MRAAFIFSVFSLLGKGDVSWEVNSDLEERLKAMYEKKRQEEKRGGKKGDRKKSRGEAVGYLSGGGKKLGELFKKERWWVDLEILLCGMLARGLCDRYLSFFL